MKIGFSSQRKERLLFLTLTQYTTDIAALTSRANQQYAFQYAFSNQMGQ